MQTRTRSCHIPAIQYKLPTSHPDHTTGQTQKRKTSKVIKDIGEKLVLNKPVITTYNLDIIDEISDIVYNIKVSNRALKNCINVFSIFDIIKFILSKKQTAAWKDMSIPTMEYIQNTNKMHHWSDLHNSIRWQEQCIQDNKKAHTRFASMCRFRSHRIKTHHQKLQVQNWWLHWYIRVNTSHVNTTSWWSIIPLETIVKWWQSLGSYTYSSELQLLSVHIWSHHVSHWMSQHLIMVNCFCWPLEVHFLVHHKLDSFHALTICWAIWEHIEFEFSYYEEIFEVLWKVATQDDTKQSVGYLM